jgi:hypothetical protein
MFRSPTKQAAGVPRSRYCHYLAAKMIAAQWWHQNMGLPDDMLDGGIILETGGQSSAGNPVALRRASIFTATYVGSSAQGRDATSPSMPKF